MSVQVVSVCSVDSVWDPPVGCHRFYGRRQARPVLQHLRVHRQRYVTLRDLVQLVLYRSESDIVFFDECQVWRSVTKDSA